MKKLIIAVLGLLFTTTLSHALPWDDDLAALLKPTPDDQTISVTVNAGMGFYEVNLDPWFLEAKNVIWAKRQLERAETFKEISEEELYFLMPIDATYEMTDTQYYRGYKLEDREYRFYYNLNKEMILTETRTGIKISFFYKFFEDKVQIWGNDTRIVVSPSEGFLIIPNGTVYEFDPHRGLDSIRNRGAMIIPNIAEEIMGVVQEAQTLVGSNYALTVNDKTYNNDCSGFVSALYMKYGMDLTKGIENVERRTGYNLTAIIFDAQDYNFNLHQSPYPSVGDLVFFSNTYDRNNNSQWDDYLSHIGIVEKVDEDANVTFIHHINSSIGVIRSQINVLHPDNPALNSVIRNRRSSDPVHFRYLSGQLFESFAHVRTTPD